MVGNTLLHLGQRLHANEFDFQKFPAAVGKMHVRIVEAGMTKCPPRSTTFVCSPFSFRMSSSEPTAMMRPLRIAMAWVRPGVDWCRCRR